MKKHKTRKLTGSIRAHVLVDFFFDLRSHRQPICADAHIVTSLNDRLGRSLVTRERTNKYTTKGKLHHGQAQLEIKLNYNV